MENKHSIYQQSLSFDVRWVKEAGEGCSEHKEGDDHEEQAIDEAGQDLHTVVTVTNIAHRKSQTPKYICIFLSFLDTELA